MSNAVWIERIVAMLKANNIGKGFEEYERAKGVINSWLLPIPMECSKEEYI